MIVSSNKGVLIRSLGTALFALATLALVGCGEVYVHEEFNKLAMNKSDAEVQESLGKPTSVDANDPKHVMWTYYSKTFDVDNQNKRDIKAVVIFEPDPATKKLKVVKVEYQKS